MVDSNATVTMAQLGTQQLVAEVATQQVTREVADLTSPGGSRPMRRSYIYQPTPPAQWFGRERAERVHEENAVHSALYVMRTLRMRLQIKRNILLAAETRQGGQRM